MKILSALFFFLLLVVYGSFANNLRISNVSQTGDNISFTISWDNSWNTTNNIDPLYPNNWDAAWVFIKYQNQIDNLWKPAKLGSSNADHSVTGGGAALQVTAVNDSMGVFIRRSSAGSGNIADANVTLKMGPRVGAGNFNFKVFGIEMVHVPQAAFQAGDGTVAATYINPIDINANTQSAGFTGGALFSGSPAIPATFPQGYNAFYCMKYELTNEQWVDFLNTLTYDQQASRIEAAPNAVANSNAYGVSVTMQSVVEIVVPGLNNTQPAVFGCDYTDDGVFNTANDGQNIPFVVAGKGDYLAYLDWSGLRPMTELEYEKACRGTRPRIKGEYAWGSTNIAARTRASLTASGTATEASAAAVVNGQLMANSGTNAHGPARSGVFATANSGRESSGATFYGIMEMSGNMWELMVSAAAGGADFMQVNGDGVLTADGENNTVGWPALATAFAYGYRGGSWWETTSYTTYTQIGYRSSSNLTNARSYTLGIRGIRSSN